MSKDRRYEEKSPLSSEGQGRQPQPERPVTEEELRREPGGPEDRPSQAEGERDESAE